MNKIRKLFDHKWWFYDFVKWSSHPGVKIFFRHKKLYVSGKKPKNILKGRLVVCSNHVSLEDAAGIISCLWKRRISFMINKELLVQHKAKGFFKGVGCIPVDKANIDVDSIKKAINVIDRGHVVGIFPEGQINKEKDLLPFKSGVVMTAFLAKADILPIYICRRTTKKESWVMVVGERIKIDEVFTDVCPSIDKINEVTAYLNKKEEELKQVYLDRWVNRKKK